MMREKSGWKEGVFGLLAVGLVLLPGMFASPVQAEGVESMPQQLAQADDSTTNTPINLLKDLVEYGNWSGSGCSAACGQSGVIVQNRACQLKSTGQTVDCTACGGECQQTISCTAPSCFVSNPPVVGPSPTIGGQRFDIQCGPDGGGGNFNMGNYTAVGNSSMKFRLYTAGTGRWGWAQVNFVESGGNIMVSSLNAGTPENSYKAHMCFNPALAQCATSGSGIPTGAPANCSSPITCRIRNLTTGQSWQFVSGRTVSFAYISNGAYQAQRIYDNACPSQIFVEGIHPALPCYHWQSSCP